MDERDSGPAALLGAQIRRVRIARSRTLVDVAESAGLSHSFLSQVERGLATPSILSLERIAVALGTSPVELMSAAQPRRQLVESHVLRGHEGVTGPYGQGIARLLGPELLSFVPMEFVGDNVEFADLYRHDEDEFVLVVAGLLDLDLDGAVHTLCAGDSATVAAFAPHRWRSADGSGYRLVVVKEGAGMAAMRAEIQRSAAAALAAEVV